MMSHQGYRPLRLCQSFTKGIPTRPQEKKHMYQTQQSATLRNRALKVHASLNDTPLEPEDARGAIAMGLSLANDQGDWKAALGYFERALELPGTGIKRFRDKPKLISNGEKMAALYNIACCQSRLAQEEEDAEERDARIQNSLIALAGCLEAGYDNFDQIRSDDDFALLRVLHRLVRTVVVSLVYPQFQ
ncbi:hypothetical protein M9435_004038 [Picochlorum sp. BPE23]|nr:hypothetical protein M9435_004038 [Picochlorum sp. BPE23]